MNIISFNPVTLATAVMDEETGEGFIPASVGTYSVDLIFKVE
jgi:hypothetical protein